MNYKAHYDNLISKAQTQCIDGYTERHHIIPKCLGGNDDSTNLVDLTPEQHYTAHLLLSKIHGGNLWFAAVMMTNGIGKRNNKLYGWVRRNANRHHSSAVKDGWARKAGFKDYTDQCIRFWNSFKIHGRYNKVCKIYNVSEGRVADSIKYWTELNDLVDERKRIIREVKSKNSRNARLSETPEIRRDRMVKMNNAISTETRRNAALKREEKKRNERALSIKG